MNIQIYGINYFQSVINWFSSIYTIIILIILTGIFIYYFYKINFTNNEWSLSNIHYLINIGLIIIYGILLFYISKFLLNLELVYSIIFTVLFYGVSIFLLTVVLLILRRYKIKKYILSKIDDINNNKDKEKIKTVCVNGEHKYLDWFKKDIERNKKIDKQKYITINIFKDENMNNK